LTARVFSLTDGRGLAGWFCFLGALTQSAPFCLRRVFSGTNLKFMPQYDMLNVALLTMVAVVLPLRTEGSFFCSPKSSDEGRAALWLHTKRSLRTL
jgi:hypothetical protein